MMYIHGAGHFHPENKIDNHFLQELDIGTTDEWIMERVGIQCRRTVLSLDYIKSTLNLNPAAAAEASQYTNAQTGALAGTMAIENAGLKKQDIGMVIAGSCTPQYSCPTEACTIAAALEIDAPSIDINSACSSLAAQLHFLNLMGENALPDYVLLVNPDNSTRHINYQDRNSCVLWGDATSAMVVSTRHKAAFQISHSCFTSTPAGWDKVTFTEHKHFDQEGRTVQTFAIKRSVATIRELAAHLPDVDISSMKFIGHQANLGMLSAVCKRAGIQAENHFFNVDQFGNCGAAGAPGVLSQNWRKFDAGDVLVLAVVGSGLSWGGVLINVI
ncbi:MAG: ketoacyl-ACP synthase III [Pseudomonadales bacterium]|nr:ketoacyl-ACP synthase III [Pseudomonadales bacterium]